MSHNFNLELNILYAILLQLLINRRHLMRFMDFMTRCRPRQRLPPTKRTDLSDVPFIDDTICLMMIIQLCNLFG